MNLGITECPVSQLLENPFWLRPIQEKLMIVRRGRPRPEIPGLSTLKTEQSRTFTRRFHTTEYDKVLWMTGSSLLSKLFCWPCLLFGMEKTAWNNEGFSNLNHLCLSVKKHQLSQNHIRAQLHFASYSKNQMELELSEQQRLNVSKHNDEVAKNREILKRLIDVVCHLAKLESPFRGHDESSTSHNRGHYLELLTLLGSYDQDLKKHLDTAIVFRGTSNHIQNDLIEAVSLVVIEKIKEEVRNAPFAAILLDETTDTMNTSQLSTVLRYVAENGKVKESFVGFTDVSAYKTADGLFSHVLKIAEEFQLQGKLVAQTYDGAAVMAGHLSDLCTRVVEKFPNALFVHCSAHRLNLVLQQVCMSIKECRVFFPTLSGLAAYFSESPTQSKALQEFMTKKLPRVNPKMWIFTSHFVNTVCEYQPQFIEFFDHIIDDTPGDLDGDALVTAQGFRSFLEDFRNSFLLATFSTIFRHTEVLYDILQTVELDISYCCEKVEETKKKLKEERERFVSVWEETITKSNACGIEEPHPAKKRRENGNPEPNEASRRLYYEIIDTVAVQLEDRYASMERLNFVSLLDPQQFEDFSNNFPTARFILLQKTYSSLFDFVLLKNELIVMYSWPDFQGKTPHLLVAHMQTHGLKDVMPEVYRLGCLILTIPSTTTSVEGSFSALKRIKSHIQATKGQERMSSLSLLSIEKEVLYNLKESPDFYTKIGDYLNENHRLRCDPLSHPTACRWE